MQELPRRHRITVEHFYRMAEAGLFAEDERVELIEGEIIDVAPMGSPHAGLLSHLAALIAPLVASRYLVRQQLPLRLGNDSEPLPDIAVVRHRDDYYTSRHPTAADVVLVVEVSSTTLRFDRNVKVQMYARHGIPELWVLDTNATQIHYYRTPADGSYSVAGTVPLTGRIPIEALSITIDLSPLAAPGESI
jgi:Uma2 family endonuclease